MGAVKPSLRDVRVLVAHGGGHIDLAIARSLSRAGAYVIAGSPMGAGLARYSGAAHQVLPFSSFEARVICREILDFVQQGGATHVITPEESLIVLLNQHRAELEQKAVLLFPDNVAFEECLYKERTLSRAARLDVPAPRTLVIASLEESAACRDWRYPVVFKPAHRDPRHRAPQVREYLVQYANSFDELQRQLEARGEASEPTMVQEYVTGEGVGVEILMREGEAALAFQHRRLREKPATGGISVFCESMAVDPKLKSYAVRLLADMRWEGPAMVEFRCDCSTGEAHLIEINGRFWGSLPLALHAGLDFPAEYLRCAQAPSYRPTQPDYPVGLRCRSLWHDAAALVETLRTGNRPRVRAAAGFLGAFSPRNRGYVWDWRDPGPAFSRLLSLVPWSAVPPSAQGKKEAI